MLAKDQQILEYIPQRPPMVMLSGLIASEENFTESFLRIKDENLFVEAGKFSAPGMVENIAQTAAARVGYICKKEKIPVPIGFIGAVKDLRIFFLPASGTEIRTKITITHQVFDVTVIKGEVFSGGETAASCEMKIFIQKEQN